MALIHAQKVALVQHFNLQQNMLFFDKRNFK